ncbi:MAG: hypothetical protein AB1733_24405 [Thermodesulfobacteriota bacterium]
MRHADAAPDRMPLAMAFLDGRAVEISASVEENRDNLHWDTKGNFREIGLDKMGTSGVL